MRMRIQNRKMQFRKKCRIKKKLLRDENVLDVYILASPLERCRKSHEGRSVVVQLRRCFVFLMRAGSWSPWRTTNTWTIDHQFWRLSSPPPKSIEQLSQTEIKVKAICSSTELNWSKLLKNEKILFKRNTKTKWNWDEMKWQVNQSFCCSTNCSRTCVATGMDTYSVPSMLRLDLAMLWS